MSGAYTSLNDLFSMQFATKHTGSISKNVAQSFYTGNYKSHHQGRGMDFDEFRNYQPGDDIRNIDWKVTARLGKPYTKIFKEEKEKPVFILLDQTQTLFFGTKLNFKSVTAAEAFAYFAWNTKRKGDCIGGIVYNELEQFEFRPTLRNKTLSALLKSVCSINNSLYFAETKNSETASEPQTIPLDEALKRTLRLVKPGTSILIISDFAKTTDNTFRQLSLLKRHCELSILWVFDPMELKLPAKGIYNVTDGINQCALNINSNNRNSYHKKMHIRQSFFKNKVREMGINYAAIDCSQNTASQCQLIFRNHRKAN